MEIWEWLKINMNIININLNVIIKIMTVLVISFSNYLGKMIIVFTKIGTFSGLKQEVSRDHFKDHTGKTPNISGSVIIGSDQNFWRSVLPGLNFIREMMMGPARVSQVCYLYAHITIQFISSLQYTYIII